MKLSSNILLFIIILFSIGLFYNTGTVDIESGNINYYNSTTAGANDTAPYIWQFMMNPDTWQSSQFLNYLLTIFIVTLTLTGILAGLFRMQASDSTLFTPVFVILVSFGGITIGSLFTFIRAETASYMCDPAALALGHICIFPTMLSVIVAGGLAIEYVMSCVQWWRTGFIQG